MISGNVPGSLHQLFTKIQNIYNVIHINVENYWFWIHWDPIPEILVSTGLYFN